MKNPIEQRLLHALLDCRDVLLGNISTSDFVVDGDSLSTLLRLHLKNYVAVLPTTSRLLDQLPLPTRTLGNRFAIRDLRGS